MALFQVERYMGQANQATEPQDSSNDLLQKLHEKAKAREKSRKEGRQKTVNLTPKNKKSKKPKSGGKNEAIIKSEINEQSQANSEVSRKQSPEKEKHKRKHADIVTDDTTTSSAHKLKKKKNKRSNSIENDDQISNNDQISNRTSKDSDRTNEDSEIQSANSTKLNKKKRKEKHLKPIGDSKSSGKEDDKVQQMGEDDSVESADGDAKMDVEDPKKDESMDDDGDSDSDGENDDDDDGDDEDGVHGEENHEEDQGASPHEGSMEDEDVGFTVLGGIEETSRKKVMRVLPEWLSHPTIVEHDLTRNQVAVDEYPLISTKIATALKQNNIKSLFPVQRHVIPIILNSIKFGLHAGNAGYRPRDICVSAPTGSGKTLAFALPVVQALHDRVVPRVRALAVLPTRDLATQVYRVFAMLCNAVNLRVVLLGGQKSFDKEQELLSKNRLSDDIQVDILVATPGRLVDHINNTKGFTLQYLRFLIIDEADRMMEEISKDWISQVEKSAYPGKSAPYGISSIAQARPKPGPVTVTSYAQMHQPMQKLLFSATLSQNPEKLTHLNLFQPRLITTLVTQGQRLKGHQEVTGDEETGEFVGKYTTPVGLTEFYIECSKADKPLVLLHLTKHLHCKQVLCFTNTVEATHRLYLLVKIVGGVNVAEFSSNLKSAERQQILKKFKAGKIDLLICSDAMARGMDIDNVRFVISYGLPPYLKTYIHRVGRTARAGHPGIAFSLLQKSEVPMFKSMLKNAGKTDIERHIVREADLQPLMMDYEDALDQLPDILKKEKEKAWTSSR